MSVVNVAAPVRGEYGEVFTRRWVVEVMLDLVGYTADRELAALRIVDPSCGGGAFLVVAVERLCSSLNGAAPDAAVLADSVRGYELQEKNAAACRRSVARVLQAHGASPDTAAELVRQWIRTSDYLLDAPVSGSLFQDEPVETADFVVGNPPYIRIEDLPAPLSAAYRSRWPAMTGRADVYIGFFERALKSLRPGGRLAFICADRWMRNSYGAALRELIGSAYSVDAVWTMHDVDAFESEVAAYPAITLLSRGRQGSVAVAETTRDFAEPSARQLTSWTLRVEHTAESGAGYRAFRLPHWFPKDEMWPSGSPERLALLEHLNDHFLPLHSSQTRTRVGIGVATGADKVFITKNPDLVESDRLLPLALTADTRSGQFAWGGSYLVNPWSDTGALVDLGDYPRLADYLRAHGAQLRQRHTAKANPRGWFRTIDKVSHPLTDRPKLLIQDMRTSINPVLEPGGCYPHHNLYYVISDSWDMEVLGGLLLSRVAQAFIQAHCVRMRGNTLRFQSQYLKKIRVPEFADIDDATRQDLRQAFRRRDVAAATMAALSAYRLDSATWSPALIPDLRDDDSPHPPGEDPGRTRPVLVPTRRTDSQA